MIIGLFISQHGLLRGLLTHDFLNSFLGLIGENIVFRYFLIFHQVVHKVGEIQLVKINPLEFRGGNAPTVRTAGAAKTDMQLTISSLLLNDLRQF